ncbi:MAG: hypothetical protein GY710_06265 [Desulfobacteraceae bacterium]|nr:hypothetical protein [Desulfobacteraceae bacterium]
MSELKVVSVETEKSLKIGFEGKKDFFCNRYIIAGVPYWTIEHSFKTEPEFEAAYQRFLGNKDSEIIEQSKNLDTEVG